MAYKVAVPNPKAKFVVTNNPTMVATGVVNRPIPPVTTGQLYPPPAK